MIESLNEMTVTEIRVRLGEFGCSKPMERMRKALDDMINQIIERIATTPYQFRFPKSKKNRIRKKWRKDPRNFRRLLDPDQLVDIEIVSDRGALNE